ncbi:MAG: hypothetical protein ACK5P4_07725 [Bacteroidota bacterium]|jgi:hypothetical protein
MKTKFLLYIIVVFSFLNTSCKRCYQCTVKYEQTTTPNTLGLNSTSTTKTEFCGTLKEKDAFVKSGTSNTESKSGNITVRVRTTTTCLQ